MFVASSQTDSFTNKNIEVEGTISGDPGHETIQFNAQGRLSVLARDGDTLTGTRVSGSTVFNISLTKQVQYPAAR